MKTERIWTRGSVPLLPSPSEGPKPKEHSIFTLPDPKSGMRPLTNGSKVHAIEKSHTMANDTQRWASSDMMFTPRRNIDNGTAFAF
ncbi:hypothetical protein IFR05_007962 [Cadophora sp. M221]|nr:hypothetical protein IFR05_007962 [Cadophora sp. M221]